MFARIHSWLILSRATAFTFLKKTGNNIHEVRNMDIEKLKAGLKNVSEPSAWCHLNIA
jgi:hypothetical protein